MSKKADIVKAMTEVDGLREHVIDDLTKINQMIADRIDVVIKSPEKAFKAIMIEYMLANKAMFKDANKIGLKLQGEIRA